MSTRTFTREELDAMRLPKCWRPEWKCERREGEATALYEEFWEECRWENTWRLIFRAPDDGKCYEIFYNEGATEHQEDADPWNEESSVTATEVELWPVIRSEWRPARRGVAQLGNVVVDVECVRPHPAAQGIADEAGHGCWEPNFEWLKETAGKLGLANAGIFAPDTGALETLIAYLDRAEAASKPSKGGEVLMYRTYFENPGMPRDEERGTYCPEGEKIAEFPVGRPQDMQVIEPWPCEKPWCTREKFEQAHAEMEADLAEAETDGNRGAS